jgi:ATP-dependent Clp protease adaptor protein ClpS
VKLVRDAVARETPRTRTKVEPAIEERADTRTAQPWNVIVWDDPINLMTYVVWVFQKLFGWPTEKATKHMLEVHTQGRSIVVSVARETAEHYVTRLHGYGLQATLERPGTAA